MRCIYFLISLICLKLVSSGTPTTDLIDLDIETRVLFYDFDKTLTIKSWGGPIRDICNNTLNGTRSCDQMGDMVDTLQAFDNPQNASIYAFGNTSRINRLKAHFDNVLGEDSSIEKFYILSTSWMPVPASEWAAFIYQTLVYVGLDAYFPLENILTLDDPGPGNSADKGAKAQITLTELGITSVNACLDSDDSSGNIASFVGICDTNWIWRKKEWIILILIILKPEHLYHTVK
eukprot:UN00851